MKKKILLFLLVLLLLGGGAAGYWFWTKDAREISVTVQRFFDASKAMDFGTAKTLVVPEMAEQMGRVEEGLKRVKGIATAVGADEWLKKQTQPYLAELAKAKLISVEVFRIKDGQAHASVEIEREGKRSLETWLLKKVGDKWLYAGKQEG